MPRGTLAIGLVGVLLCGGWPLSAAPERSTVGLRVSSGDLSLQLRKISFGRSASFAYDASGLPLAARPEGEAEATLEFALGSRDATGVDRVVTGASSGPSRNSATDSRGRAGRVAARVEETDDGARLLLRVAGLSPEATGLSRVDCELLAYPRAERVRFHIPWLKDEVPLKVEFGGGSATLRKFQLIQDDSTLWISVHPPDGYHVAPFGQANAVRARAVDIYGNLVNGGGIAASSQTSAGNDPEFQFFAPGLTRVPSRLMLDVLCVSGEPQPLRFHLQSIRFPTAGR